MTLADKIGQMLCFGWSDVDSGDCVTLNSHADALVSDLRVGGVILMGRNISPPDTLRALLAAMQDRARECRLPPLFVAIDQEGGRVSRLAPPLYATRPSACEIGGKDDAEHARQAAFSIGHELKGLGFNWNFAPVLDVNNNPNNPVIGSRSYGSHPEKVSRMGVAATQGFQTDAGILACGKHFPGHGDTDKDSHYALPRINRTREELKNMELFPFRAAIEAGIGAIMTAHILFPALDPVLPATLSPVILTDLLREEMKFTGLVITDDLEMQGVGDKWGAPEAAVLAVLAGADMLLCCHAQATQYAIRDALAEAVHAGRIPEQRLDVSLARIAAAKSRWVAGT